MVGTIAPNNVAVSFDIGGDDYDLIFTDYKKVMARGVNINRLIPLIVEVPKNQHFCSVINCYLWNQDLPEKPKLIGVQTMDLAKILKEYYRRIKLNPGEVLPNDENNDSDQEEAELIKTLFDEKNKKQAPLAQIKEGNLNEEDELFNLDKLDLNIPQELLYKKELLKNINMIILQKNVAIQRRRR